MNRRELIAGLGAAALPVASRAQPVKLPHIGVLWHAGSADEEGDYFKALIEGFTSLGYVDGQNVKLEHRFPNEIPDRFRGMSAELVSSNVDVLIGIGAAAPTFLEKATTTIPIVFALAPHPVASNLVNSLSRPGGNATGLSIIAVDLSGKRLQLLREAIPKLSSVGLLINPNEPPSSGYVIEGEAAATSLGLDHRTFHAHSLGELEAAFDAMVQAKVQAVVLGAGALLYQGRAVVAKLALERHLPICAWSRETFEPGALLSYGADHLAIMRRTAVLVDKILKGTPPADIPVEQPTKLQLLVNLKTATALQIEIPPVVLIRADEVIE